MNTKILHIFVASILFALALLAQTETQSPSAGSFAGGDDLSAQGITCFGPHGGYYTHSTIGGGYNMVFPQCIVTPSDNYFHECVIWVDANGNPTFMGCNSLPS